MRATVMAFLRTIGPVVLAYMCRPSALRLVRRRGAAGYSSAFMKRPQLGNERVGVRYRYWWCHRDGAMCKVSEVLRNQGCLANLLWLNLADERVCQIWLKSGLQLTVDQAS